MAHDLITAADVTARSGTTYAGAELTKVNAFIDDASALVRLIAETDFHDPDSGAEVALPAAIKPALVSMVRRALEVPVGAAAGLSSETLPSYSWAGGGGFEGGQAAASIYATRREIGIIRNAAGVVPMKSIAVISEFDQDEDADEEVVI